MSLLPSCGFSFTIVTALGIIKRTKHVPSPTQTDTQSSRAKCIVWWYSCLYYTTPMHTRRVLYTCVKSRCISTSNSLTKAEGPTCHGRKQRVTFAIVAAWWCVGLCTTLLNVARHWYVLLIFTVCFWCCNAASRYVSIECCLVIHVLIFLLNSTSNAAPARILQLAS